jgi:hydrogenase maturation protease
MTPPSGTLILGWGNPGRLDDGLGPALVSAMEADRIPEVHLESEYQLQVEDAEAVARHERVVFVDADRSGAEPFSIRMLKPAKGGLSFSTHSVSAESVMALSRDLFGAEPEAWLMGIRGYQFDNFGEQLSEQGQANLAAAVEFLRIALRDGSFREIRPERADGSASRDSRGDHERRKARNSLC